MNSFINYVSSYDFWQLLCNLLAIYAIIQILIYKVLIRYHDKKLEYYPHKVEGGSEESWARSQESLKYSKTKRYKFIERLKRIF